MVISDVHKRLQEFKEEQQLRSVRALALSIGADPSFFDKIYKGQKPISDALLKDLERVYRLNPKWVKFGAEPKYVMEQQAPANSEDLRDKLIQNLERTVAQQEREISSLNDRIGDLKLRLATSLTELEEHAKVNAAHLKAVMRGISAHRSKMEKVELGKVLDEHRKFFDEEMLNILKKDN